MAIGIDFNKLYEEINRANLQPKKPIDYTRKPAETMAEYQKRVRELLFK